MPVDVVEKDPLERALVAGVRGKQVAWLSPDGHIHLTDLTVMHADVLEVPRCEVECVAEHGEAITDVVARVASAAPEGMSLEIAVHWPAGEFKGRPLPESIGVVFADSPDA